MMLRRIMCGLGKKNNTVIRLPHKWYAGNNYT
jgi:hypothetical protein